MSDHLVEQADRLEDLERRQRLLFLTAHDHLKRIDDPESQWLVDEIDRFLIERRTEYIWAATLLEEGRENRR